MWTHKRSSPWRLCGVGVSHSPRDPCHGWTGHREGGRTPPHPSLPGTQQIGVSRPSDPGGVCSTGHSRAQGVATRTDLGAEPLPADHQEQPPTQRGMEGRPWENLSLSCEHRPPASDPAVPSRLPTWGEAQVVAGSRRPSFKGQQLHVSGAVTDRSPHTFSASQLRAGCPSPRDGLGSVQLGAGPPTLGPSRMAQPHWPWPHCAPSRRRLLGAGHPSIFWSLEGCSALSTPRGGPPSAYLNQDGAVSWLLGQDPPTCQLEAEPRLVLGGAGPHAEA